MNDRSSVMAKKKQMVCLDIMRRPKYLRMRRRVLLSNKIFR